VPNSYAVSWRILLLCCFLWPAVAIAQTQDPENERRLGLWLDQTISAGMSPNTSMEFEFHQRFNDRGSHLFEYFFQVGPGFALRPWLRLIPSYRYQRFRDLPISYENRLIVNLTLSTKRGRWQPILRTLSEGRFPQNRIPSARIRLRPGIEYTLPLRIRRPPVLVVNNELFFVPGTNSFASGGSFTQNRFQAGFRLPLTGSVSVRPYFMLQSVNLPSHWETNGIIGISLGLKF
jgi:hypothetical protein